jgi:phosphoglycolate phosphatase/putative hydrolase of the HAD superfamily
MKIFSLPENGIQALFFDMDCTLYTHDEYARTQIDLPVERLARLQGKTFEHMKAEVAAFQKNWAESHDGKKISLGNTLLHFGISIEEIIRWREDLYLPEKYLVRDEALRLALVQLARRFSLAVVTNNPVSVAVRTFSVLGIHDILQKIVGLDTLCLSKPHEKILREAAKLCGAPFERCVSVGDRYDIDIALPLELGMGGILVDGVEDVYKLPDLII